MKASLLCRHDPAVSAHARKLRFLFGALAACVCLALLGCAHAVPATVPTAAAPSASPAAASPAAAAISPAPSPSPSPVPTPTPLPTPFSVVWISDTQRLSESQPLSIVIAPMFRWIADNREAQGIQLMIHTGDIVENGFNPRYWAHMEPEMMRTAAVVPLLAAAGNHDIGRDRDDYSEFVARDYLAGSDPAHRYDGGKGYWVAFRAGGTDFIAVSLGYGCYDEAGMAWMRQVFSEHADSVGVIAVHDYMSYKSCMSIAGVVLRDGVVARCPNVRLVLCGHVTSIGRRQDRFDDDGDGEPERVVNELVYNYQQVPDLRSSGYFRILTFDPVDRSILVRTYSPYWGDYNCTYSGRDAQEFTLTDAF